jgi:hypothetical protein
VWDTGILFIAGIGDERAYAVRLGDRSGRSSSINVATVGRDLGD